MITKKSLLFVSGVLTDLDLEKSFLKEEGVVAICEALQSNKETKLASLNLARNFAGLPGAKSVAAMLAVTGSITQAFLSGFTF